MIDDMPIYVKEKMKKRKFLEDSLSEIYTEQKEEDKKNNFYFTITQLTPERNDKCAPLLKEIKQLDTEINNAFGIIQQEKQMIRQKVIKQIHELHTKKLHYYYERHSPKRKCKICESPLDRDGRISLSNKYDHYTGEYHYVINKEVWHCKKCGKDVIYLFELPKIKISDEEKSTIEKTIKEKIEEDIKCLKN